MGFDETVVGGAAGHDDVGSDASFVLADAFEDALALFGGGRAVGAGGCAEDDDGVEVGLGGVVGGEGDVVGGDDKGTAKAMRPGRRGFGGGASRGLGYQGWFALRLGLVR